MNFTAPAFVLLFPIVLALHWISIESQIDFCKYELKGGSCRVFKDKGYSGKNTDRPEFQKLLGEIRKGKVRRVIGPYKPLYSGLCNDDGAVSRV